MKDKYYGIIFLIVLISSLFLCVIAETKKEQIDLKFEEVLVSEDAININTATKEELMTLDGIGESLADKIIHYRETVRQFEVPKDVTLISGFGEKRYEDNKNKIKVID